MSDDVRGRLREALARSRELPPDDVDAVSVLIDAGELAIALETLCTQIYEYDIELDAKARQELLELGQLLGVAAGYLLGDPWEERPPPATL